MKRRAFVLAQVVILSTLALGLAVVSFGRTTNQMHLVRRALDAEQAGLMLDALEQLTSGQSADLRLTVPGWTELTAVRGPSGWTLTARGAGAAASRVVPAR